MGSYPLTFSVAFLLTSQSQLKFTVGDHDTDKDVQDDSHKGPRHNANSRQHYRQTFTLFKLKN